MRERGESLATVQTGAAAAPQSGDGWQHLQLPSVWDQNIGLSLPLTPPHTHSFSPAARRTEDRRRLETRRGGDMLLWDLRHMAECKESRVVCRL